MNVTIKKPGEIESLRKGGKILAEILEELTKIAGPGIATVELDRLAEELILKSGGQPSFKGYRGFPSALCVSINETVVHGLPSSRKLKEGDIAGFDLGMIYEGLYTDAARTVGVGKIGPEAARLIEITENALKLAIRKIRPGKRWGDVASTIQKYVEQNGFGVVRDLVGHGVGYQIHEDPWLPNFGRAKEGVLLKAGMVLALEPMVTEGDWHVEIDKDGWGFKTKDGKLAAHFEDTVAVTETGCEVLTR